MKINMPVTGVERKLDPAKPIVTKTDLKGVITYANQAFVDISGFSREELIGKSHNVVRHPDMPPEAFADLWRVVAAGHPWSGLVKNRCKNGDHYWVEAFVTPITESGRRIGYMSVRTAPSNQEIGDAERLYQDIRRKSAAFPATPLPRGAGRASVVSFAAAGSIGLLAGAGAWFGGLPGLGCALAAMLIAAGNALAVQRRLIGSAAKVIEAIAAIDEGQLAQRVAPRSGSLSGVFVSLEALRIHLRAMFADVLVGAREVEERAQHLEQAMRTLIAASEAQTDSTQQIAAAMEQMSVSISEVSANTERALGAAQRTETVANAGMESANASIASQRKASEVVSESSCQIDEVNKMVGRISHISGIIRDIAEQTNLLALNAAIEAARAGDQGRGFAVVADEVRKLSERTAASTTEIVQAVTSISEQSGVAVASMGKATAEVEHGAAQVEESNGKLDLICEASRESVSLNREISAMLQQQSAASQEVANSMERISAATESGHASIADVGVSASSLRQTADELHRLLRHMESALQ
jgi:aerotaxis receptor